MTRREREFVILSLWALVGAVGTLLLAGMWRML